jgi:hypothetical protein
MLANLAGLEAVDVTGNLNGRLVDVTSRGFNPTPGGH